MKIQVGNIRSRIQTDNPELLETLRELYRFRVKGAEYTPAFSSGVWDGYKDFITRQGIFRSGLLSQILDDLKKIGCEPEVEGVSTNPLNYIEDTVGKYTLRDYQQSLAKSALYSKRCIIKAPTGSGKTIIMASIVNNLHGRKMVLLFNTKQLVIQAYSFLVGCGITNVGICFGGNYEYGDIMCCTVQSISKILDTHLEESEVLIVDECHEFCKGKTTVPAIQAFDSAEFRFGFTATPPKDEVDLYTLIGALGPVEEVVSTQSLINRKELDKPIIQMIKNKHIEGPNAVTYSDVYSENIINNKERNLTIKNIVDSIVEKNKSAKILILVDKLDHRDNLRELIPYALYLSGDDDIDVRYDVITEFIESKKRSVLIGSRILQTGVNIEEITHFINARGLRSDIATIQALGRALRKNTNKVYIYDFLDIGCKWLEDHADDRLEAYKAEGHEVKLI